MRRVMMCEKSCRLGTFEVSRGDHIVERVRSETTGWGRRVAVQFVVGLGGGKSGASTPIRYMCAKPVQQMDPGAERTAFWCLRCARLKWLMWLFAVACLESAIALPLS